MLVLFLHPRLGWRRGAGGVSGTTGKAGDEGGTGAGAGVGAGEAERGIRERRGGGEGRRVRSGEEMGEADASEVDGMAAAAAAIFSLPMRIFLRPAGPGAGAGAGTVAAGPGAGWVAATSLVSAGAGAARFGGLTEVCPDACLGAGCTGS